MTELEYLLKEWRVLSTHYTTQHLGRSRTRKLLDKLFYNWDGRSKYSDFNNIILSCIRGLSETMQSENIK